ncbi:MAG: ribonuclease HI [Nitriliruptorales bacterium]|nr:ribonuclease HI [Nitriliruptorales bacterium]
MSCRTGGGANPARKGGRTRAGPVEENLTTAQVLEKYREGPTDGVFTDGSAHPNPGPGGWGAVYVVNGEVIDQAHGRESPTTNNRMELTALIKGFDLVPVGTPAVVYTDSKLCVDTITKWAPGWERAGWKRKSGPVQNLDLVKELYATAKARPELQLQWIAAHNGARWNEYADSLSTAYLRDEL